ncbi:rhodanese-like domain-containing protein [Candidatus Latescibacterota bacterium]
MCLTEPLKSLQKVTYLIYCLSGGRSRYSQLIMEEKEFMEVYNMLGGILEWEDEGYAIVEK